MPGSANLAISRRKELANYVPRSLISASGMGDGKVALGVGKGGGCSTNPLSDTGESTRFIQKHGLREEKMKSLPCPRAWRERGLGKSSLGISRGALSWRQQLCQHPCALPEAGCCPGLSGRILLEVTSLTNMVELPPLGKFTQVLPLNIHPTLPKRSPLQAEEEGE